MSARMDPKIAAAATEDRSVPGTDWTHCPAE